ncbi:MAG: hypothetical protein KA063_04335 [Firmicutes bacterium]|nr:hypothetical protein [Bacillota bacterium]
MSRLGPSERDPFADHVHMLLAMSVLIVLSLDIYRLNPVWGKPFTVRLAGLSLVYAGYIRAWQEARASVEKPAPWNTRHRRHFWDWFDSMLPWRRKPSTLPRVCAEYDTLYRQLQMSMRRGRYFARFLEEHGAPLEAREYAHAHLDGSSDLSHSQVSSVFDIMEESL